MAKKKPTATPVESIRHKDKRKNIPTEELRDFVTDEEHAPRTMLYPRDPSLDPQLVWKGKDEQDRQDLAVPVVPIYIQEKIHPQAIIDDIISSGSLPLASRERERPEMEQLDLFADFNGLPEEFDQRIDFYQHDAHWSNRMILGDSLLVMTSMAEKESLKGKVQTIYLDPPYGIRFGSNWQVSTRKRDVKDGKAEDATRQPEQVRAFRDTWKLGIHSYLAYLRDRLVAARELLTETGSVFVQIGDENVHLVRAVMDEVFGSENAVCQVVFRKTTGAGSPSGYVEALPQTFDYLLWYAKSKPNLKLRRLYLSRSAAEDDNLRWVEEPSGVRRRMTEDEAFRPELLPSGSNAFRPNPLTSQSAGDTTLFPVVHDGRTYKPGKGGWKTNRAGMDRIVAANRLFSSGSTLCFIRYLSDFPYKPVIDIWDDTRTSGFGDPKVYVVQTNVKVIERCILLTTDPGDLVLDPTCGSGTTAYVAEQWGRRWITCDTSRVALALARTRLMAAKFPYYYLADQYPQISQISADEEIKKHLRKSPGAYASGSPGSQGEPEALAPGAAADIRKGFIYRRVPHVTLKSIANNPDIKEGMSRAEIDAAIARHADSETLFDQPYQDNKRVRVSGPFTVESLSPHRTISVEEKKQRAEVGKNGLKLRLIGPDDFATMIIDNLRKAGVQNTIKNERLKFDELKPYAGEWIHAEGWYTETPLPSP